MVDSMKDIIEAQMEDPIDSKWQWKETRRAPHMLNRIFWPFIVFLLGIAFGYAWHFMATADASPYIAQVERNPKVLAAMKYHGIRFCTENDGRITFQRDGQTCRLYTNAFEKSWREK